MKKYHKIICASYLLLIKEGRILLLRRSNTGYEDGNYSVPAGHVDQGESVMDCLVREATEEIGIVVEKQDVRLSHVMHRKSTDTNEERIDFFFTCSEWTGEAQNMEPEKCDDLSWHSLDQLPENIIPYIEKAIRLSQQGIPFSEQQKYSGI